MTRGRGVVYESPHYQDGYRFLIRYAMLNYKGGPPRPIEGPLE